LGQAWQCPHFYLCGRYWGSIRCPFEIAKARQWVEDHSTWKPSKLMTEAKKQNWDPSIQGLVAFPKVLARLYQGVSRTTSLGNAVLVQQADVMQGSANADAGASRR
jgi:hypothetical protein